MNYDHVVGFYLHIKNEGEKELKVLYLDRQATLLLPISKKKYKTTLKNVKAYCKELLGANSNITDITIDVVRRHGRITR